MTNNKTKGFLLGAIAAASYGMNPLFTLPLYSAGMSVDSVLFYRYALAIVVLGIMMKMQKQSFAIKKADVLPLCIMGLLFSFSSLFLFMSYNYMDAGIASTILFVYPVLVAIIMAVVFKEKVSPVTNIIICIWCVLSGGCVQNKSQDSLKTLKTEIRHIIKDKKATIGVALILDGEDTLAINNAEKYPMMSVYKFHQALAVCDYLQKRHIPLSTSLYLDKKYFKPDTYSPLRDKYPQGNLELPISELLVYTMQSSDNVACDILFDYIGGVNVVDEYIHSLGINDVSITATEDEMHQDMDDCYKNWTTPMEAANLLELFMTQDFMRNEYTDFLKHIMIECGTGKDRLPAPLPESEVKIGHKTGTSDKNDRGEYIGINDIGFVILPDGSRYVVAVFVKDSKENMETNAKIISDISAAVYRYAGNR